MKKKTEAFVLSEYLNLEMNTNHLSDPFACKRNNKNAIIKTFKFLTNLLKFPFMNDGIEITVH